MEILIHGMVFFGRLHLGFTSMVPFQKNKIKKKTISNDTNACFSKVQENRILHSSCLDGVLFISIVFYQFSVLHHIFLFKCVEDIYVYILIYINPSTNQFMSFFYYTLNHAMIINKIILINVKFTTKVTTFI